MKAAQPPSSPSETIVNFESGVFILGGKAASSTLAFGNPVRF
ncbi:hypothetical protein RISK_006062 [Rhodopirellula islandica]|uniref:Uncharacterized protein n=1 Tax=Rhodopirellula islandica TaxID=595434 RepID=A0A0J1B5M4_RHOIS|nr:hypothetical protein RISK_006062 [Rhodopirellula islandica]